MKIAGIQISSVIGNREGNFKKVENFFENICSNQRQAPDVVILPEVWTVGWDCSLFYDLKEYDGKTEEFLSSLAKKYSVNIIGGSYIKAYKEGAKNHCPVFNREGKKIGEYEKIHLYSPDGEADFVQSGKTPSIVEIEGVHIGLSICYDIRFPELFRSYINTKNPPEIMLNISAWPKTRRSQYKAMAQARAIENQCYFIGLSQTGLIKGDIYNAGHSLVAEPMGEIVRELDESENVLYLDLEINKVYETREKYPNLSNRQVFDFGFEPCFMGERG